MDAAAGPQRDFRRRRGAFDADPHGERGAAPEADLEVEVARGDQGIVEAQQRPVLDGEMGESTRRPEPPVVAFAKRRFDARFRSYRVAVHAGRGGRRTGKTGVARGA